jgi:hypothetical protein
MEYSGKQCLHADFIIYDMIQPLERLLKVASNARSLSSRVCVCLPFNWRCTCLLWCLRPRLDERIGGEKHCIRIPVAFRLYLVKIIQILTN